MLALARSLAYYLKTLEQRILPWYDQFDEQLREYTLLHNAMTDPSVSHKQSVQAELTLTRWFDVIVFA